MKTVKNDARCQDMDPVEIRIALIRAGVAQTTIARKLGVCNPHICDVIAGKTVSHRVRKAIADAIGMDLKRIWPSTYLYGGPRKPGRPAVQ